MAKPLTAAGILRYKPGKGRREIRDGAATGLYVVLQESGQRSFALRFRKPNGKSAKLTLGPVDVSGVEPATAPSLDSLGAPLTLAGARQLAAELHRQRAMGRDVVAHLPPWVFSGVMQWLKVPEMRPPYHEIRWMRVREAMSEMNLLAPEAYEWASKKLADTPARAGPDMMMKSYQKVERRLPKSARRPRTRCKKERFLETVTLIGGSDTR